MSHFTQVLGKLWANIVCICRHGKTRKKYALSRLADLKCDYSELLQRYYRPPAQRKLRSADSLFHIAEPQMLALEAAHSITTGDYAGAHAKIDSAREIMRDDDGRRYMESLRLEAKHISQTGIRRSGSGGNGRRKA